MHDVDEMIYPQDCKDGTPCGVGIGWTAGSFPHSAAIRWADPSREPDGTTAPAAINHVLLTFTFPGVCLVAESLTRKGVALSPRSHLEGAIESGRVLRFTERALTLSPAERREAWRRAQSVHAKGYDKGLILRYLVARSGSERAQRILARQNDGRYTCNEFAVFCLRGLVGEIPGRGAPRALSVGESTPERLFSRFHGHSSRAHFAL